MWSTHTTDTFFLHLTFHADVQRLLVCLPNFTVWFPKIIYGKVWMVNILDAVCIAIAHTFRGYAASDVWMSAFHDNYVFNECFGSQEMLCVSDTRLHHYFDLYPSKLWLLTLLLLLSSLVGMIFELFLLITLTRMNDVLYLRIIILIQYTGNESNSTPHSIT